MRNLTPYLLIVLNCCIGPALLFCAGLYIGRRGLPLRVEWRNSDQTPPRARSFTRDDE